MIEQGNCLFMAITLSYDLGFKNNLGDPCDCAKVVHFGGFGYHGNLIVFFGFWFLVCRVSSFVCRYSESGLETPFTFSFNTKYI